MRFPALPLRSLGRRTVALLFIFLISSIVFLGLTKTSFAQNTMETVSNPQSQQYLSSNTTPDVPKNLHTFTQSALIETISAMSCQITGIDPTNPDQKCLGVNQKTGQIGFVENGGGVIGILASSLNYLYTPPLHTGDYISYLSKNFGLAKHSYAAGTTGLGFDSLNPLVTVWTGFRNIAYLFFILVFLVIGVAIMLRVKIDPRTVMTIQNQIPKIIIGVIMVTFSFAIAGVLIDLMWTEMYVSYGVLSGVEKSVNPDVTDGLSNLSPLAMYGSDPLGLYGGFIGQAKVLNNNDIGIPATIAPRLKNIIESSLGISGCPNGFTADCAGKALNPLSFIPDLSSGNVISITMDLVSFWASAKAFMWAFNIVAPTGYVAGTDAGGVALGVAAGLGTGAVAYGFVQYILREFLPWLLIYLIIYIAVLFSLLRLWFELVKAYIFIIFDVVLAPFWMIAGLIPGNTGMNFGSWLKDLASNLAAFPAVAFMFWMGKILMDTVKTSTPGKVFVPPLVGNPNDPNFLAAIIGLGVLLSTPMVVAMVKKAFKAPKVELGGAAAAIGLGAGVLSGTAKQTASSIFVAMRGSYPNPNERGGSAILRGIFNRFRS